MGSVATPRRGGIDAAIAAAVALLATAALHWNGTGMISDSWAFWQGAISLATGNGYTYFSGAPIAAWPPLYPAYLAPWVAVAGPHGWVLTTATAVLVVLQAALWMRLVRILADDAGIAAPRPAWLLLAVFTGLFLAVHQRYPFSQGLVYVILPLFMESVWAFVVRGKDRHAPALVILAVLLPLTHTSCFAFVGAGALLVAARTPRSARGLGLAALVLLAPVAAWLAVRLALGQAGSHCIGPGTGRFDMLAYAVQEIGGPGRLLVPDRFGAPLVAMAVLWLAALALAAAGPGQRALRFVAAFCALSLAALFALFNLAWIYAPIGGRFVLFVAILLVAMPGLALATRRPRLASGLLALLLLPQLYWFATWMQEQRAADRLFARQPTAFLPHDGYASRDHLAGPPLRQGNRLLVAPDPEAQTSGDCR